MLSIILLSLCTAHFTLFCQPHWDNSLNFDEIEHRLHNEQVAHKEDLHSFLRHQGKVASGTHMLKLITLESGLKAVFKKDGACYGEVAAYNIAKALNLRLIPPTVMRTIDGVTGSLQFFVASKIDLMKSSQNVFDKLNKKTISDKKNLYYLLCQWDTHKGNQIIAHHANNYYLALIDNGAMLSLIHNQKLHNKHFYQTTLDALKSLTQSSIEQAFIDYPKQQRKQKLIERMLKRRDLIIETAQTKGTVIYNRSLDTNI